MSAEKLTEEELLDTVTIVLPRAIVKALMNPDGEFYNGAIFDKAAEKALNNYTNQRIC
jgi:hypothetical protein